MRRFKYLAFDLGAESGRALVGELEDGRLQTWEVARFPNGILYLRGRAHWNVFRLYEQMIETLAHCVRDGLAPDTIGVDTWGVDFALLDAHGAVSGLPFAYRDRQTIGAMESFFHKMSAEHLYERTGIQMMPINSVFQLEAMRRDGEQGLRNAADLLFMPDLFHYFLCGVKKTEFTFATTTQLFNPCTMGWDPEVRAALGLPEHLLQEIVTPGTVLGPLAADVARQTGMSRAEITAVATHDTASAVAALPVEDEDHAYISCGTWSLMGVESPRPVLTPIAFASNFTNEGGVGGTFRVLKNIAGLWPLQECRRLWGVRLEVSYMELVAAARVAPAFVALCDLDDPDIRQAQNMPEALEEYFRRTGQPVPTSRGSLVRSILESLALKYRFVLEQLRALELREIRRLHLIGGGAYNTLLCQFTADATGLPVIAGPVEATAIGNLLVQAMATGEVDSLQDLRAVVRGSFGTSMHEPHPRDPWDAAYARFLDLNPK
jgi:rhamnulokinase